MRLSFRHAAVAALTLSFLSVTGCDGVDDAPTTTAPVAGLSGEQLFTGLVLGNGEAAAALPEVWNAPEILKARSQNVTMNGAR
jgi:hypothetical protein